MVPPCCALCCYITNVMKNAKERLNLCDREGREIHLEKCVANYVKTLGLHVCMFLYGTQHMLNGDAFSQEGPFQDPCMIS